MIRLENITKIYNEKIDDTKALDNVTLTIEDGEFVSIMGPSGSGKSTLLKIIGCMDSPTGGTYYLGDTEATAVSPSQIHKLRKEKIGFVFQHFALMDYYTAYENIELPLLAANVKRKERKKIILKQMENLGILSVKDKLPGKMSGGQQQRVAIARALVTDADIILADEPTGALDQKTGREVLEILKRINMSGKTVIIVTHDEGIAKMTNRIITMCDGKVVGDN
ncbi:MAG: ABC transporter ATP-binding protein [Lachnospira sp.]